MRRLSLATVALSLGLSGVPSAADWRTASREPVGLAPDPSTTPEAIVQVYTARTFGWRGRFAVHSWIAVKPTDAPAYTVYEVIGWRKYRDLPPLVVHQRAPDARWFGSKPELLFDRRGSGVDDIISRIETATRDYPYADAYRVWPGPNSNTYIAHVIRRVPELACDLPPTAIGKDFLTEGFGLVATTPSGTGLQLSLSGLLGITIGLREGLEFNLLGLVFGIDPDELAIKLPVIGRIGLLQRWS
jgi:hypothetical protein